MNTKAIDLAAINASSSAWAEAVGAYFRNFAMLERLSIECVTRMADPFKYKSMKKKFLAQRLTWIMETVHEHTEDAEKADSLIEVLESIREASYFRNQLAHGAAGLVFPEKEGGSPTLAGILNFKPEDDTQDAEMISLEEIRTRAEESGVLAERFLNALNGLELSAPA